MPKNFEISLPPIEFDGVKYKLGLGGIHSVDEPGIFKSEDGCMLLDLDVTSYYPAFMILYNICPDHLDKDIFNQLLKEETEARVAYKKRKKESYIFATLEYGCKIEINSFDRRGSLK